MACAPGTPFLTEGTDGTPRRMLETVGGMTLLSRDVLLHGFRHIEWKLLLQQLEQIGWRSLSIVNLTALFTGMVMALQLGVFLSKFGAKIYISGVIGLAIVRELGPTLSALMIGARAGAGIAAELGSMAVTEQLDALRALGADPLRKLVMPRLLALLIVVPALTVIADALGILGGSFIAVSELRVDPTFYFSTLFRGGWIVFDDVFSGLGKSVFFAFIIGVIACYNGMMTSGGADGVGRATTRTVVTASITILLSDFFLTKLFLFLPDTQSIFRLIRRIG